MTDTPSIPEPDSPEPDSPGPDREPQAGDDAVPDAVDLLASAQLDVEPSRGDTDPVPPISEVDAQRVDRRVAEFHGIANALREEPVHTSALQREDAIAAAMGVATTGEQLGSDAPVPDELAVRRSNAAIPTPARSTPRFARSGLVAAALLLVAAVGLIANIAGNSSQDSTSSEDAGSAEMGSELPTTDPSTAASGAADDTDGGFSSGQAESRQAQDAEAPAIGEAAPLSTTTLPGTLSRQVIELGTYDSLEELLSAVIALPPSANSSAYEQYGAEPACTDERTANGLAEFGRASVDTRPVIVARSSDPVEVVVFDAATCSELARRAA